MLTIQDPSHDPFYNQAFEEFVFQTFTDDDVFLLWQNSPAVIVGSYQNICHEVQIGALRRKGIPVVRRISGGGTVYHDLGNVNYTYITQTNGAVDYDAALGPVIAALNAIGVPARKDRVCDIAIGDQKISGSAQRMVGGRLLHHGTLLFSSDLTALERITHQKNDCVQSKGTRSAICTVTNIRDHLTVPMTIEAFQANLLDQMVPPGQPRMTLTPEQESEVCRLRDEKYRSWDWTWGKTPAFTYDRSGIFAGVPIHVTYRAKHGIISDAALDCAVLDGSLAARSLNGARLDPDVFAAICRRLAGGAADELLDLLL